MGLILRLGGVYETRGDSPELGETAGTLVLWDADTTANIKQVGVWLPGQTVDASSVLHVVD